MINNVDVLLVYETKLDDSFLTTDSHCSIGGGILLHVKDGVPSSLFTEHRLPYNVEYLFIEINVRNKKWLLCYLYNRHKNIISNHISHLSKVSAIT